MVAGLAAGRLERYSCQSVGQQKRTRADAKNKIGSRFHGPEKSRKGGGHRTDTGQTQDRSTGIQVLPILQIHMYLHKLQGTNWGVLRGRIRNERAPKEELRRYGT